VEVLVQAKEDVAGRHLFRQALALLLTEASEEVLELGIPGMQGPHRGANEMVQIGEFEELSHRAEANGALVSENEKESQEQTAEEGKPNRGAEERDKSRIEVRGELLVEPGSKSGTRDAHFCGILPLRSRAMHGIGEGGAGLGDEEWVPAGTLLPGVDASCSLF
jgi:hypothetical protein